VQQNAAAAAKEESLVCCNRELEDDRSLQCRTSDRWHHLACTNLSELQWTYQSRLPDSLEVKSVL